MKKILSISVNVNFTPNTLSCCGLMLIFVSQILSVKHLFLMLGKKWNLKEECSSYKPFLHQYLINFVGRVSSNSYTVISAGRNG